MAAVANQATFVGQAQTIASLWNQFTAWYYAVQRVNQLSTKNGAQNGWKAMATAAYNNDGSIGTADGTPNNAHPITVSNLDMSANDIINALNDMITLCSVFDGTLAPASYFQVDHRGDAPSVSNLTS
jgi:hypothetical protein